MYTTARFADNWQREGQQVDASVDVAILMSVITCITAAIAKQGRTVCRHVSRQNLENPEGTGCLHTRTMADDDKSAAPCPVAHISRWSAAGLWPALS